MKKFFCLITLLSASLFLQARSVDLSLIPPGSVSDKVNLDVRAGIVNDGRDAGFRISLYCRDASGKKTLKKESVRIKGGNSYLLKYNLPTSGMSGKYEIELQVRRGLKLYTKKRPIEVVPSETRSLGTIDGAYAGIAHWSEIEGKLWNSDIRKLSADDWKGIVRSMHHIGMDIIVVQELFRSEHNAGSDSLTVQTYDGKAYYPSSLYPGRQDVACEDPVEAIMEEADRLGMYVLPGIGLYAWFDFSKESLEWHKAVTKEVFERYGHHDSFYGFYVSEESNGGLDNWETDGEKRKYYQEQIVEFFREYKSFCRDFAPAKPIMLSPNCYGIADCREPYLELLENLDILCSFCFARMPENDLTGKECADLLQSWCDEAGSHLWFDLEAFLFNPDGSLYPRDFAGIKDDLLKFDNFEKVLCYQYPGVFNNPSFHKVVGEPSSIELCRQYTSYRQYREWLIPFSKPVHGRMDGNPKGIYPDDTLRAECIEILLNAKDDKRMSDRLWQAVPSIASTEDGSKIYVAWNAGGRDEEMGNYATVAVSEDGGEHWIRDALVVYPKNPANTRVIDVVLWRSTDGNIHLKFNTIISDDGDQIDPRASLHEMVLSFADGEMNYTEPEFLTYGMMINPPLEIAQRHESLYPVYRCSMSHLNKPRYSINPECGTFAYKRKAHRFRKFSSLPEREYELYDFDEHCFVDLSEDGRDLMCIARFRDGINKSFSRDYGRTWSEFIPMTELGPTTSSKSCITKLASGRVLLVYNASSNRENLTMALSDDGCKSWNSKLCFDTRDKVSYPSVSQTSDGTILVAYDHDRYGDMDILFFKTTEDEIINGVAPEIKRITDL